MAELHALATLACGTDGGDQPLASTPQGVLTRAAWRMQVQAWVAAFALRPGQDCAMYFDDAAVLSAALFGAWHAGRTPWLAADTLPATLQRLLPALPLRAGELPDAIVPVASTCDASALAPLDLDRCTLVLHTSGSEGEPTALRKTLRQLAAEVDALDQQFGAALGDANVHGTVSPQHIYGLLFRVLWPLAAGRAFASPRLAFPEQIAALRGATVLVATPAHLKRLPDGIDWSGFSAGLRTAFSSGGPLPPDAALQLQQRWQRPVIEVFGSTETGGIAWRHGGGDGCWRALPRVRWRIGDGRLQVRSPHLASDDWVTTDDRARAHGDGFELLGRADRIVKLEERRIAPASIERRLRDCPSLQDVRVVLLPGARASLGAVVCLTASAEQRLQQAGRRALVAELRAWLDGHVDPIAVPRRWRFVPALPVDARGKTSARALQALFRPPRPVPEWRLREPAAAELVLPVAADLAGFEGHFPDAPVLPGVVMLDWVAGFAREAFGLRGACRRMEALKFQHIVTPGRVLSLRMDWRDAARVLEFRITSAQAVHASGRLRFDPEPAEAVA